MRGYAGIDLPISACVHFVRNSEIDESISDFFHDAQESGMVFVYINYRKLPERNRSVFRAIAEKLNFDNLLIFDGEPVPFLDDLITLAYRIRGLVIVIDNADEFLSIAPSDFFDLIEAFLVQFHHWFDKKKPCHLCFQMESNPMIEALLG